MINDRGHNAARMKMMALVIAMVMCLAMAVPAMGAEGDGAAATAPTTGSITINSPIVGATYKVYKVFDMTTNAAVDAFSYTIDTSNDFYGAVVEYAGVAANGLTLSRIEGSDPAKYNVSVDESKFDAQKFGKAMQAVLENGSPAAAADQAYTDSEGKKGIAPKDAGNAKINENASKVCTITDDNTSDFLKFEDLALGYFLVNPTYPDATGVTVTMGSQNFTVGDLDEDGKLTGPDTVEGTAAYKIKAYAEATVNDAYVDKYIADHGITTNKLILPTCKSGSKPYSMRG